MAKSTKFNEFENIYRAYASYESAFDSAVNGRFDPDIPTKELAAQIAFGQLSEEDKKDENKQRQVIESLNDPHNLPKYLKMGMNSYGQHFLGFGKNNLESIIKGSPKERIEELAFLVKPYEIGNEEHDYIVRLHKGLIKMRENLGIVMAATEENRRIPKEVDERVEKEMIKEVDDYYASKYSNNPNILELFKLLNKCSDRVRLARYSQIASQKEGELKKAIGNNHESYVTENLKHNKDNLGIFSYLATGDEKKLLPPGYEQERYRRRR